MANVDRGYRLLLRYGMPTHLTVAPPFPSLFTRVLEQVELIFVMFVNLSLAEVWGLSEMQVLLWGIAQPLQLPCKT